MKISSIAHQRLLLAGWLSNRGMDGPRVFMPVLVKCVQTGDPAWCSRPMRCFRTARTKSACRLWVAKCHSSPCFRHCRAFALEIAVFRGTSSGVFTEYALPKPALPMERIEALPVKAAVLHSTNAPNAMDESAWTNAAVWRITVPAVWRQHDTLLRFHFVGDVARLYAGGKLVADKFYNGQPFDFALWRIPPEHLDTLELQVMPLHPKSAARLPGSMRPSPPLTEPRAEVATIEALLRQQLPLTVHAQGAASSSSTSQVP